MLNEMTRINSHLVWLGTHAMDIGAMTVFLYCFREREDMLRLFEAVSGQRMMTSYFRIGGLALEPPLGFFERVKKFTDRFPADVDEYEGLLTANPIWRDAPRALRISTAEDVIALGGNRSDPARQRHGYRSAPRQAVYAATRISNSKCRFERRRRLRPVYVRVQELRESQKIVEQALEGIARRPIKADAPRSFCPTARR